MWGLLNYLDFTKISNYNNNLRFVLDKIISNSKVNRKYVNCFDFENNSLELFLKKTELKNYCSLWKEVYDFVKNSNIYVYHCSKVLNVSTIHKDGLLINSPVNYINTIDPILQSLSKDYTKIKECIINELNRKNEIVKPNVCFFYPKELTDGFSFFNSFIGG